MNIMLVDDDKEILLNLANFLTHLGYNVSTYSDGNRALDMLEKEKTHLVLSDINMPGLDGYELLRRLKSNTLWQDIVVILFTGFGDIRGAVQAMREGAWDYLLKPIDMAELKLVIERVENYIVLRNEHRDLTERFDARVEASIRDWRRRYQDLLQAFAERAGLSEIGVFSPSMRRVFDIADRFHASPAVPVLIEGETGTGKEVLAKYIHYGQEPGPAPLVDLNCASIPSTLFESELFGYEAGAFTGGNPKGQAGKIEMAAGGTLFLDEIGELSLEHQAKLLRLIQERTFYRVGGVRKLTTDARIICATNQNLEEKIAQGTWRKDLYYRLQVGLLQVPPLRKRREEILPLAELFLRQICHDRGIEPRNFQPAAREVLQSYTWPGNIRELRNTVERIVILFDAQLIEAQQVEAMLHRQAAPATDSAIEAIPLHPLRTLREYSQEVVQRILEANRWNKAATARSLGISRATLYSYLNETEPV